MGEGKNAEKAPEEAVKQKLPLSFILQNNIALTYFQEFMSDKKLGTCVAVLSSGPCACSY
jgi:hypothetical protein